MRSNKTGGGKTSIYGVLNRISRFKQDMTRVDHAKNCPIYSPPQNCVKSECVWYDHAKQECWIINPRPLKDEPTKG